MPFTPANIDNIPLDTEDTGLGLPEDTGGSLDSIDVEMPIPDERSMLTKIGQGAGGLASNVIAGGFKPLTRSLTDSAIASDNLIARGVVGTLSLPARLASLAMGKDASSLGEARKALSAARAADAQRLANISRLTDIMKEKRARGEDTTHIKDFLTQELKQPVSFSENEIIPSLNKTTRQIMGEALLAGVQAASLGGISAGAKSVGAATSFKTGAVAGAKAGALTGGIYGGVGGVGRGLEAGKGGTDLLKQGLKEGAIGVTVGGVLGALTGGIAGGLKGKQLHKAEIQAKLATDNRNQVIFDEKTGSAYKLGPRGELVEDKFITNAVKSGVDPLDAQYIANSSPADRQAYMKMYQLAEKASKDKTYTGRPVEVAGKSLIKRIEYLDKQRRSVGKELGDIVKNLPKKKIDITQYYDDFVNNLDEAGVKIYSGIDDLADDLSPTEALLQSQGLKADFSNSRWADQPAVQKQINVVLSKLRPNSKGVVTATPADINTLRQRIFTNLDLGKRTNEVDDYTSVLLQRFRDAIDEPLKDPALGGSPRYAELAQKYAKTSQALGDFNKLMGRDFDLSSGVANLRAGEVGARILGNASARPAAVIDDVERVATELGFRADDNLYNQYLFSKTLEDYFPITPPGSLGGQTERAINRAVGTVDEVEGASSRTISGNIIHFGKKGIDKLTGVTPDTKRKAILDLISGKADDVTDDTGGLISGAVQRFKDTPGKEGGYIANPLGSDDIPTLSEATKKITSLGGYSHIDKMPLPQRNAYGASELAQSLGLNKKFLYENATKKGIDLADELQNFDAIRSSGGSSVDFTYKLMDKLSGEDLLKGSKGSTNLFSFGFQDKVPEASAGGMISHTKQQLLENVNYALKRGEINKELAKKATSIINAPAKTLEALDRSVKSIPGLPPGLSNTLRDHVATSQMEASILGGEKIQQIPLDKIVGQRFSKGTPDMIKARLMAEKASGGIPDISAHNALGKEVTTPISVELNSDGTYSLIDGNHRLVQAIINGAKNIKAFVKE